MGNLNGFAHASRYDPVKAHEYYVRTRELKGRSTKDLSDEAKEGWTYVKDQVTEERKGSLKSAAEANKKAVEELRRNAEARRKEIQEKLKQIMERISDEGKVTREEAKKKADAAIDALPDMPAGLTKQQRAEFSAKRTEEIAKIRGEQKKKNEDVSLYTKARSTSEKESAAKEREQIGADIKASFERARQAFDSAKEEIRAKYEAELAKEFGEIQSMPGAKKPKKRKRY